MSEEQPVSRTHHTPSASCACIDNPMHNQIAGITVLVEDDLTRLLGDAGQSIVSSPHPGVIGAIQTVPYQAAAKVVNSLSLKTAVEQAVHNMEIEASIVEVVATLIIASSVLAATAAIFVKNEGENVSLNSPRWKIDTRP